VFHIDVTAAWHPLPLGKGVFGAGANGFYLQQTSGAGASLGGFKTMSAGGGGPTVSYAAQYSKIGFASSVTWLPQIGVKNTGKGNYIWFKLAASL
jgi:hypothetical protein